MLPSESKCRKAAQAGPQTPLGRSGVGSQLTLANMVRTSRLVTHTPEDTSEKRTRSPRPVGRDDRTLQDQELRRGEGVGVRGTYDTFCKSVPSLYPVGPSPLRPSPRRGNRPPKPTPSRRRGEGTFPQNFPGSFALRTSRNDPAILAKPSREGCNSSFHSPSATVPRLSIATYRSCDDATFCSVSLKRSIR
jgi:hypothetical protein